ncbi:hypothetical protein N7485_004287 [Penicillium canescens]|nr:hypothetical protein N7485_004287 [Penicillium canescens]
MFDVYKQIDASRSDYLKKKRDLPWGFAIYRCSYKDESAWNRLLQYIEEQIKVSLECNKRMDLLPHHQLVINDDITKFNGATSHEIRDHFNAWVVDQLPQVVASPAVLERLRSDNSTDQLGPEYSLGARYNFCLFVDDFCLESIKYINDPNFDPMVKVLSGSWGNLTPREREYQIHPDWHDGETDDEFEMVGWMYIPMETYVWWYDALEEPADWDRHYLRPPMMFDGCNVLNLDELLAQIDRQS